MSHGLKLKKPSYLKNTKIYSAKNVPEVMLPILPGHVPAVAEGSKVLCGQLIAQAPADSTPVYSSISGRVLGIENVNGIDHIRIENDGQYTAPETPLFDRKRISEMTRTDILERIRLSAIPEWKYLSELGRTKRLVINCLDTDNYSSDKKCAIHARAREIIGGSKILLKLLGLTLCELVIEKRSTDQINDLLDHIGESTLFDVIETDGKYPFGSDLKVISQLPSPDKAKKSEICVISVHTAAAIYRAFSTGRPWITRLVSVGGPSVCDGGCFELPLGTPVKYIAEHIVKATGGELLLAVNGAIGGRTAQINDTFVTHDVSSLVFVDETDATVNMGTCIGCAVCDDVCPEGLALSSLIRRRESIPDSQADACIGCGACSYVCPAKLPIHDMIRKKADPVRSDGLYKKQKLTSTPLLRSADSTRTINLDLIFALCALVGWAICRFGIMALVMTAVSLICAVSADVLFSYLTKGNVKSALDLSSVVCGLVCALTLSIKTPLYVYAAAAIFAVAVVRGAFGGTGKNIIHSAFCARIFVSLFWHDSFVYDNTRSYTMFDHLLGNTDGALGEVSFVILIACAIYLLYRRAISLSPTISTIASFVIATFLCTPAGTDAIDYVKITLISSAVVFVSIFSSSEYSTLPPTLLGRISYGAVCGSLCAIITQFTSYEGAYVASVVASLITVLIFDRIGRSRYASAPVTERNDPEITTTTERTDGRVHAPVIQETKIEEEKAPVIQETHTEEKEAPDATSQEQAEAEDNFDIDSNELLYALTTEIGLEDEKQSVKANTSTAEASQNISSDELFRQLYDETE